MLTPRPRDEGTGYEMRAPVIKTDLVEVGRGTPMGELLRRGDGAAWHYHPTSASDYNMFKTLQMLVFDGQHLTPVGAPIRN